MNWEEYQNTDFYRESHQSKPDLRSQQQKTNDKREELMRNYIVSIDCHDFDNDGDVYHEDTAMFTRTLYAAVKMYGRRTVGFLGYGDYRQAMMLVYDYNVSCINDEWSFARVEKIVVEGSTESELEEALEDTLLGYRELSFEMSMEYEDFDW